MCMGGGDCWVNLHDLYLDVQLASARVSMHPHTAAQSYLTL